MAQSKKKSLFAQRMTALRETETSNPSKPITDDLSTSLGSRSCILTGGEANQIHSENVQTLSGMPEETIIEERDKLLSTLDPELVAFLQSRRKQTDHAMETECRRADVPISSESSFEISSSATGFQFEAVDVQEISDLVNKYPHMDVVEDEKLKWIGELPEGKLLPDEPFQARFNFEGELLPYIDEGEGVLKGLHNHGEEQERPGYTLQELMQLSRSAVLQQRVIALNTISNILSNANKYEAIFIEPLMPVLLDQDLYLLLRFSLDDPSQRVVMASAGAISNLIVNHSDELCLDVILGSPLGLQQPSLGVILEMNQVEIEELKDVELLKLDIIRGMIRTNILERIKYILEKLQIEPAEMRLILKILVRMIRHSFEVANAVFMSPGLLSVIHKKALACKEIGLYYPEALKLFRVMAARSKTLAENILEQFDILTVLFRFICGEQTQKHPDAIHLTLESFYTWQTFLTYGLALDSIRALGPIIMKFLAIHLDCTELTGYPSDLEHAIAIFTTISAVAKLDINAVMFILPLACQCGMKWIIQYAELGDDIFTASKLVGAVLQLFALTYEFFDCSNLEDNLEKLFKKLIITRSLKALRKYSWLISGQLASNLDCLPHFGTIPPTLQPYSSLPFVFSLTTFLINANNKKLVNLLMCEEELIHYLKAVVGSPDFRCLFSHWFARQELCFIVSVVLLYTSSEIEDMNGRFMHQLAFELLTVVHESDKHLLGPIISKVVFNPKYFRLSVDDINERLSFLRLEEENIPELVGRREVLENSIESLRDIEALYVDELRLQPVAWPPSTLTTVLNSTQPAFPFDWIFIPIMRLHQCEGNDRNAVRTVDLCLKWYVIIEEFSPNVLSRIRPSAIYCRMCCVYLAGPNLFLEVTPLLGLVLTYITNKYDNLDFDEPIPGLSSFYDFYREVLEQYASVSYCDTTFGRYILMPLAQKHHVKYKKIVWSELAPILRLLRTSTTEVNMKHYLEPTETDPNLLMTYLHAVATGLVRKECCPVLHKVAFRQVVSYINSKDDITSKRLKDRIEKLGNTKLKNEFLRHLTAA